MSLVPNPMTGIKISVERLQVGNYVSLPLGWREHPFLFSSFKLKSEEEIELIRRLGLKLVTIIPDKSDTPPKPLGQTQPQADEVEGEGLVARQEEMQQEKLRRIEQLQGRESQWQALDSFKPAAGGRLLPPMRTLQIVGGRKEKIRPGDVMGALAGECGLTREQVGKINVNEFSTYVAVLAELAQNVTVQLGKGKIKGRSVKVRLL